MSLQLLLPGVKLIFSLFLPSVERGRIQKYVCFIMIRVQPNGFDTALAQHASQI